MILIHSFYGFNLKENLAGGDIGINYGRNGNDLPSPKAVVDFLTKNLNYDIPLVRLFYANLEVLEALRATNLVVTVGVTNEKLLWA
jgi:hypothetical protein